MLDHGQQLLSCGSDCADQPLLDQFDELRAYKVTFDAVVAQQSSFTAFLGAKGAVVFNLNPHVGDRKVHPVSEPLDWILGSVLGPVGELEETRVTSQSPFMWLRGRAVQLCHFFEPIKLASQPFVDPYLVCADLGACIGRV
jgi:hypothetical protein